MQQPTGRRPPTALVASPRDRLEWPETGLLGSGNGSLAPQSPPATRNRRPPLPDGHPQIRRGILRPQKAPLQPRPRAPGTQQAATQCDGRRIQTPDRTGNEPQRNYDQNRIRPNITTKTTFSQNGNRDQNRSRNSNPARIQISQQPNANSDQGQRYTLALEVPPSNDGGVH